MNHEIMWTLVGITLLFSLLGISVPLYFTQSTGTPTEVANVAGVVGIIAHQYYWEIFINGSRYVNVAPLVISSKPYLLNATSADVTSNLYMVMPNWKVDFQLLPQYASQYLLYTNVPPGFYVFANSEYNGPLYSYSVGGFVMLRDGYGFMSRDEAIYYLENYAALDPLNPPAYMVNNVTLTALYGAVWSYGGRASVPGPTLIVPRGEEVTLAFRLGDGYLYTTSILTREIIKDNPGAKLEVRDLVSGKIVAEAPLSSILRGTVVLSFNATSPAYVYGVVEPLHVVLNEGNPSGNPWIGYVEGYVTPLWGVVLVYG